MDDPQKILALLPNWLGDAAMSTPALRALHRRFPQAQITIAGRAATTKLLAGLPFVSNLITLPPRPGLAATIRAACRLRPYARDLAIVFPHSFRSALLARLTGSRRRIGYARGQRTFLLTDPVPPHRENGKITPIYMAREYVDLLAPLGCTDDGLGLQLAADPAAINAIKPRLDPARPHVGIAPGAAFGPSKLWPPQRYAQVADALADHLNTQCVLLTGPGEETTRDAVRRAAKTSFVPLDGAGAGIDTLKAAVSLLDLLIGNDSGTRHVAVAFHVPTICIMGPTSPAYSNGPYETGQVLRVQVDCGPCQKTICTTDHRCMTQITTQSVIQTALDILAKSPQ